MLGCCQTNQNRLTQCFLRVSTSAPSKMDQIKSKLVDVVLIIQETNNFDTTKPQILFTANFNERTLESDPIPTDDCREINSHLIWEINKRDLRKIRTLNQPIRIDCYLINEQKCREKYGHVLLDIRYAQILGDPLQQQLTYKWYKLIGVRNRKRNHNPELYLSVTIRNHNNNNNNNNTDNANEIVHDVSEEQVVAVSQSLSSIPVSYQNDGYIQIGDDADEHCEDFLYEILLKTTRNLDLLLPEILIFNANRNNYHLMVRVFGVTVRTKEIDKHLLHDCINVNEKILINLKSNLDVLQNCLKDERLEIGFYSSGDDLLGITQISLENLLNLNQRLFVNDCLFKFPSVNGRVPMVNNQQPSISMEMHLLGKPVKQQESGDHQRNDAQIQLQQQLESGQNELQRLCDEIAVKRDELNHLQQEIRKTNQDKLEIYDKSVMIDNIHRLEVRLGDLQQLIKQKDDEILKLQNVNLIKHESFNLLDQLENLEKIHGNLQLQCNFVRDNVENSKSLVTQ